MKIGILIDRIFIGGVEKIAIQEVAALRDQGHDASLLVLSRSFPDPIAYKSMLKDIDVIYLEDRLAKPFRLNFKIPFFSFFSFFHISYPFLLPWVVKKKEYDFIISHSSYTTFTALTLSKFKNINYGMYCHDHISYIFRNVYINGAKGLIFKALLPLAVQADKTLLNNAKAVFVGGVQHSAELDELMKDPSKKYLMAPGHSVVLQPSKNNKDYFLLASSWKYGKNLEQFLEAIKMISNKSLKIRIAGKWIDTDYQEIIVRKIAELNLGARVEIVGAQNEKDLNELYFNAKAAIVSSNERGFGMTILEASANGTTFIAPSSCGAAWCYKNKVDGFFYNYNRPKELIGFIDELLNSKILCKKMGLSALHNTTSNYTWPAHVEKLIRVMT